MQLQAEGRGNGTGVDYKPWILATSFSSLGRTRRVWSPKSNRMHHLLSDVEYSLFLMLEWALHVVDIREQFPLPRDLTMAVAEDLGIKHPYYPRTDVPLVMTVDVLATTVRDGVIQLEAFDAKRLAETENFRSLEKLEISRRALSLMDVPHVLVFDTSISTQRTKNLAWIRDSIVKPGEVEPATDFWKNLSRRMTSDLAGLRAAQQTLADFCGEFDARHGLQAGSGLRVARLLMLERVLRPNLDHPDLSQAKLSDFVLTGQLGQLRVVKG